MKKRGLCFFCVAAHLKAGWGKPYLLSGAVQVRLQACFCVFLTVFIMSHNVCYVKLIFNNKGRVLILTRLLIWCCDFAYCNC